MKIDIAGCVWGCFELRHWFVQHFKVNAGLFVLTKLLFHLYDDVEFFQGTCGPEQQSKEF